jgi:hypothetical protein
MDKETLSNYGWIIILVLILAVLLALASPFGLFVNDAIKEVTGGFWDVNSASLNAIGLATDDLKFSDGNVKPADCGIEGHYVGDDKGEHQLLETACSKKHKYACECSVWTVPEGGTYYVGVSSTKIGNYTGARKVYNAGETLPCGYIPVYKDVFVLGDYEYRYKYYFDSSWQLDYRYQKGWGVRVLDTSKTSYGEILGDIVSQPVTNLNNTFYDCKLLKTAPAIPENVTTMESAFNRCYSLVTPPDLSNLTQLLDMNSTFNYCSNLTVAPVIPNSVTNMKYTFEECKSLTTAPIIPSSVTDLSWTFNCCENLKTYVGNTDPDGDFSNYVLPNNTTDMSATFQRCYLLTTPPTIPNKVTTIKQVFSDCTSLTIAPLIPDSITDMNHAFENCTNLKTYVGSKDSDGDFSNYVLSNNTNIMEHTFSQCDLLIKAPKIPESVTDMFGTFYECKSLTTVQPIPSNVTDLRYTFEDCTSLTGTIEINANPTDYDDCFYGVYFKNQNLTLTGNSTMLDNLCQTGNGYCSTCHGACLGPH